MKAQSILFLMGLLFSLNSALAASEAECTSVDLRAQVGPIRNQGNIGWCFANAGADLMGYEFSKELGGKQVSAIHVAMSFNTTLYRNAFDEGGSAFGALHTYLLTEDRVCLQTVEDELMNRGLQIPIKSKLEAISQLKKSYDLQTQNPKAWDQFYQQWSNLKKHNSLIFSMGDTKLMNLLETSSEHQLPMRIADTLCAKQSVPVKVKSRIEMLSPWMPLTNQNDLVDKIDQQLTRKNILGLAYYASFMTTPDGAIYSDSKHMSVLVGRKWNQESRQCEYLIRNSWGESCNSYTNPILKGKCEKGNVWMPEDALKKIMFGITYFAK